MNKFEKLVDHRQMVAYLKDYLFIFIGVTLYAIGYNVFILPEKIVQGGLTGIASLFYYAYGWSPSIIIWGLNAVMLAMAYKFLNKQFVIRTIAGVTMLSVMIAVVQWGLSFIPTPIITPGEDRFMHVMIGAMLGGAGLGIIFVHNGSTGGTDIIVALVNKFSRMSMGRVMQFVDITIICSSFILFRSLETIVYGVVFTLIATFVVDYVINGARQTVQFLIISKRYQQIADDMNHKLNRGVTILEGQGWYSKQEVKVVMVLCRKYESQYVFNLIKAIDPNAMVSQTFCHGVFGEGFDKIK
ncbi:MAG: YitT family protein [Bacteroidales bacterium]|nr:YitT family protein [Bacteroidales bacterium]